MKVFTMWSNIWRYRYFIFSSIKTEFRVRFLNSRLGGFWMIINPLAQVLMFVFVLSAALSTKLPGINNHYAYALYLMSGILGWSLFAEIVTRCVNIFIEYSNALKKLVFPKVILPVIVIGSALVNNLLLFAAILLIFALLGHFPSIELLWLVPLTLLNISLAVSIGLSLGILNVFLRDIGHILPVAMQFLFWFTPIVYMLQIVPSSFQHILAFNPLLPIISSYHQILLYKQPPSLTAFAILLMISLPLLSFSLFLFRKANSQLVDVL